MNVSIIGELVEHTNGDIDLCGWVFDCDCCSKIDEAVQVHHQELIRIAKEAGTYSFRGLDSPG